MGGRESIGKSAMLALRSKVISGVLKVMASILAGHLHHAASEKIACAVHSQIAIRHWVLLH
jgi:hypothetical protein